ncbi:BREX protein BrxB domain-containing protein [Corallococcus macrosporus]|uniref:DUF1788 domain-containing protein n=1 Tax=Corallococcus macrosporus DSM 14697 TaxID=1189310 RepID=A0A250JTJ8_9BACT|nr:BREX protein BrxB domain-containing protein [Corallococcus macrosporus]ATB47184.1 hypothetical protein MYMAC_002792 [Corallococcus macrosporus DSM 14697]
MTDDLFTPLGLDAAVASLEKDLVAPDGPSISTMRNHNFAILLYLPAKEYQLRQRVRQMVGRLEADSWAVLRLALHELILDRLEGELGLQGVQELIERERRLYARSPERALKDLQQRMSSYIDGSQGLVEDVAQRIADFRKKHPDAKERTLVLLGRAGALYPFFRSSALLKQLGGRTENVPVVLLYPGERREGGLSFMQELTPDRDYRPRIYA